MVGFSSVMGIGRWDKDDGYCDRDRLPTMVDRLNSNDLSQTQVMGGLEDGVKKRLHGGCPKVSALRSSESSVFG